MTVNEAIQKTQGRKAGIINRVSACYAQSLLLQQETVVTAVVANIKTHRDSFPGVVVLTDQRVMAVCGLPGIKRSVILPIDELERCEEVSTVIQYKATFRTHHDAFGMSIDPDDGEAFSPYVAEINGEKFEDIRLDVDGNILNPNLIRSRKRNQLRKQRERARGIAKDAQRQKQAAARFDAEGKKQPKKKAEQPATTVDSSVSSSDPQAVAARLAAELAEQM